MYEFKGGTGRLVTALYNTGKDPERLQRLADLLYYYPDQLQQDIDAANAFFEAFRDEKPPQPEK